MLNQFSMNPPAQLSAEQSDHLVPRVVDVDLHGAARVGGLVAGNCAQDVGVPDPARHGLRTERIEPIYVRQREVDLTDDPFIACQFRQAPMEGPIRAEDGGELGVGIILRGKQATQLGDLLGGCGLGHLLCRKTLQHLAILVHVNDVADGNGSDQKALAPNAREPLILHEAGAGLPHRSAAGSASLGQVRFGKKLSGRQLRRDQPVPQDAIDAFYFP